MMRLAYVGLIAALVLAPTTNAHSAEADQSELVAEARTLARQYGGYRFYLEKAEPAKATKYIHTMMFTMIDLEAKYGANDAEYVFNIATGMTGWRKFFILMNAMAPDGSLYTSDGPCTYFWQQSRDGRNCGERAAHPNQRVR